MRDYHKMGKELQLCCFSVIYEWDGTLCPCEKGAENRQPACSLSAGMLANESTLPLGLRIVWTDNEGI